MKKAFIMACALIAGCRGGVSQSGDGATTVSDGAGEADVRLVTLANGTKCAVLVGYQKGSIDCDWSRQ